MLSTRPPRRDPLLAVLLVLGLWGCGRSGGSPPADLVRLVDLADEARICSAVEIGADDDLLARGDHASETEDFSVLDPTVTKVFAGANDAQSRVEGDGAGRCLFLAAPGALLRTFVVQPGETIHCRLRVECADPSAVGISLLEFTDENLREVVRQADDVKALIAAPGKVALHHVLEQTDSSAAIREFAVKIPITTNMTRSVAVLVETRRAPARVREITLIRPGPAVARLLGRQCEFHHPYVRRVRAGLDYRESYVLAAPGEVRIRLQLPARDPRLTFAGASLGQRRPVILRASVSDGAIVRHTELSCGISEPEPWQDARLDLGPLAGHEVEVVLAAEPARDGDSGVWVAFAEPRITGAPDPRRAAPPDVVIISLDTVRADRMSLYEATVPSSPTLERLAKTSLVFDAALAATTWTLPSHVSIFTGQYPDRHGVDRPSLRMDPGTAPLLARAFRARGFQTAAFTGSGFVHPDFGFDGGFERYGVRDPARDVAAGEQPTELARFLAAPARTPRFVFVHTFAAHDFFGTQVDLNAVGASTEDLARVHRLVKQSVVPMKQGFAEIMKSPEDIAAIRRLYDAGLHLADQVVTNVFRALESCDRLDRTLFVVLSDHGQALFEHGDFGHGPSVYDEVIRVPLLIRGPGVQNGRYGEPVSLVDIAPTLRELFGLDPPDAAIDGRSLVPVLLGGSLPPEPLLAVAQELDDPPDRALRMRSTKLMEIRHWFAATEYRLYDLAKDPLEQQDLAPAEPQLIERLVPILASRIRVLEQGRTRAAEHRLSAERRRELQEMGYLQGE